MKPPDDNDLHQAGLLSRDPTANTEPYPPPADLLSVSGSACQDPALTKVDALSDAQERTSDDADPFVSFGSDFAGAPSEFSELRPFPRGGSEVLPFRADFLPKPVRGWVYDIAERMQCPIDYPGVAVMVVLGSLIGRKCAIRPKQHDDWTVVPNLWGAIVGDPGVMKTPAIREVMRPLEALERAAKADHASEFREYLAAQMVAEQERKVGQTNLRQALAAGESGKDLASKLVEAPPKAPVRCRLLVNDATVEKLGEILADNPNGVLVYRDELTGFLHGLERKGQESARAFYLECWDGLGSFTYDRIGRGTVDIDAAIVSILGGIQPGPLRDFFEFQGQAGKGSDGLLQRLQLMAWPVVSPRWRNVDELPKLEERQAAEQLYRVLHHLDAQKWGAVTDAGERDGLPYLRFDDAAQARFNTWRAKLELRLRSWSDSSELLAHMAKYRSLVPSLALILHLSSGEVGGAVGEEHVANAIAWAEYLESHARKIYSIGRTQERLAERTLALKILDRQLPDGFTLRDLERKAWSGLTERGDVERVLETLGALGWVLPVRYETGGRPTTRYRIRPNLSRDLMEEGQGNETATVAGQRGREVTDETDERSVGEAGGAVAGSEITDTGQEVTAKTDRRGPAAEPGGEKGGKPGSNGEFADGTFVSEPVLTEADKTDERVGEPEVLAKEAATRSEPLSGVLLVRRDFPERVIPHPPPARPCPTCRARRSWRLLNQRTWNCGGCMTPTEAPELVVWSDQEQGAAEAGGAA